MKKLWLLKSVGMALALTISLVFFVRQSSSLVQAAGDEPTPTPVGKSLDPLPPYRNADGSLAEEPSKASAASALSPQQVSLDWVSPFTESTRSISWGDYDQDGDLDLLVGNGLTGDNRLYRNDHAAFTSVWTFNCSASAENTASVSWFDYDQDGYLDIAVGNDNGQNCLFHNNTDGTFTNEWTADDAELTRDVAWAGWVGSSSVFETFMAVANYGQPSAISYLDAGQMYFLPSFHPNANTTSLAWGDYDNDGYPDLVMGNSQQPTVIYHNDVDRFSPAITLPVALLVNDVAWGDMNNDGYLDLALGNGRAGSTYHEDRVFCNSGDPTYAFTECWSAATPHVTMGIAWGDYDGDGDLDLAATSDIASGGTRIYVNDAGLLGTSPAVTLSDNAYKGSDVAWADTDGDGDLELAVAYQNAAIRIYDNLAGYLVEHTFEATTTDSRAVAWGDFDNDNDLDLAVANTGSGYSRVYRWTGTDLTLAWSAPLARNSRSVAWGDFDGDGDLDLAVGNGQDGGGQANQVFQNIGGNLTLWSNFSDLTPRNTTAVAWGDMDGDDDLDLVEVNYEGAQTNRIFINNGGVFTQTWSFGPLNDRTTSLALADFDQDDDLDIVVGNYLGVDRVYTNEGGGVFNSISLPAPSPSSYCASNVTRSVAWADWEGDGDLDIAEGMDGCVRILRADAGGSGWSFAQAWIHDEYQFYVNGVAWGDADGDGDPDLALGLAGQYGKRDQIYRNIGGSMELVWTSKLADTDRTSALAWGDVDQDGDPDLAVVNDATADKPDRLYFNTWQGSTNLPNDPIQVWLLRPDWLREGNAWHFSSAEIMGEPVLALPYFLKDDEYDRAFLVEHQVSFDGGYRWEPAWEYLGSPDGLWADVAASPAGVYHEFQWDALSQLLHHQGIPFTPTLGVFAPFDESAQEMDIAFRVVAWSNPEHGGFIQRPVFGSYTSLSRVDVRPDWSNSVKLADRSVVHPGEIVDFSIVVTQTDHGMPAYGYVEDYLPWELTRVGPVYISDGSLVSVTAQAITWTNGTNPLFMNALNLGDVVQIDFSAQLTRPLTNGLQLQNCADIYDGLHSPFQRCVSIEISSTAILTESWKLVNGVTENSASPGDTLTYTIVLTNTGSDNARATLLTDTISSNLVWLNRFSASSGTISYTNGLMKWGGDIDVFDPVYITYVVAVASPLPGNTLITNTFTLNDGLGHETTFTPVTTTVDAPDLHYAVKWAQPSQVELEDPITYTILISNTGSQVAHGAVFHDPIPPGSAYITNTFQATSGIGGFQAATNSIHWTGDIPLSGVITLTFNITAGLPARSPLPIITNTATLTDAVGGLTTLVATSTVLLPDLSGSSKLAVPSIVELGDTISFTLVVSNTGGFGPDLHLTDALPTSLMFALGSLTSSDGHASYNSGQRSVLWSNDLTSGDSATIQFGAVVTCPVNLVAPLITNTAIIQDSLGFTSTLVTTNNVYLPDLSGSSITTDAMGGRVEPGHLLEYTITLVNSGGKAPRLWMLDDLPSEVDWTDTYEISRGTLTYDALHRRVRWNGDLDADEATTIRFKVRVKTALYDNQIVNIPTVHYDCAGTEVGTSIVYAIYQVFLPLIVR